MKNFLEANETEIRMMSIMEDDAGLLEFIDEVVEKFNANPLEVIRRMEEIAQ